MSEKLEALEAWLREALEKHDRMCGHEDRMHVARQIAPLIMERFATPANGEQVERMDIHTRGPTPTQDARERVKALEEALEPFAKSILADPNTLSGWRFGYNFTVEQQRAAHLAYYGVPTTLAALGNQEERL